MGFPNSEVGYTSATTGKGDHEVHKGHVVPWGKTVCWVDIAYNQHDRKMTIYATVTG
jgi:hypothetical protein